jgi:hypothetical protein
MPEEIKRDQPQQLQPEGQGEVTQEEKSEVVFDDNDPIEVLKATAKQYGLSEDEIAIMTKKELQSFLDKKITEAIKTREENLKKKMQEEELKKKQQYEELLKLREKELLELKKQVLIQNSGLPAELAKLVEGETEEQIKEKIATLQGLWQKTIETSVQKALEERLKGKTPTAPKEQALSLSREALKKMTPEQINELFESGELQKLLKRGG